MMELALRTSLVLAVAFAVATALRRATPATRHLLWHVTMLLIVAAPLLQPVMPRVPLPLPISLTPEMTSAPGTPEGVPYGGAPEGGTLRGAERTPGTLSTSGTPRTQGTPGTLLPTLWLFGSSLAGVWFFAGWSMAFLIARRATRAPLDLTLEMHAVARELRVKRMPALRLMASARGPLTVGIRQPVILLPAGVAEWTAERRRAVFAHELAHVRRADTRTQALAHFACSLYWFNPLAWMAMRAMRRERERACDDEVLALGIRPSSYAQDLLEIARDIDARVTRVSPSAALAMARRGELEGRLLAVLAPTRRRTPARGARWMVSGLMLTCAVVAFGGRLRAADEQTPATTNHPAGSQLFYDGNRQALAEQRREDDAAAETLTHSSDQDAREQATMRLALSSDPAVTNTLIDALDDTSAQVREKAALGLGLQSSPTVIEPLLRALGDPDAQVREKAAMGLSLRRDPRVVDALLIAITDADAQVREKAAIALGTSGDPRAIPALKTAIEDRDQQVREKAALGLVLLTSGPLGPIDRRPIESGLTWIVNSVLRAVR